MYKFMFYKSIIIQCLFHIHVFINLCVCLCVSPEVNSTVRPALQRKVQSSVGLISWKTTSCREVWELLTDQTGQQRTEEVILASVRVQQGEDGSPVLSAQLWAPAGGGQCGEAVPAAAGVENGGSPQRRSEPALLEGSRRCFCCHRWFFI